MSASPVHHRQPAIKCVTVLTPFLKHLNTGPLALLLFIALAFLTNIRGREAETKGSIPVKATKAKIVIDNFGFSPTTSRVPVGATVTWTNHDPVRHVVTSADNQFQKSPVLNTGQSFSNTFAITGTFPYFCSLHPHMTGKIVVK